MVFFFIFQGVYDIQVLLGMFGHYESLLNIFKRVFVVME